MSERTGTTRRAGLKPLAESVIRTSFNRRHESSQMRSIARQSIRDARLWLSIFGRADGR